MQCTECSDVPYQNQFNQTPTIFMKLATQTLSLKPKRRLPSNITGQYYVNSSSIEVHIFSRIMQHVTCAVSSFLVQKMMIVLVVMCAYCHQSDWLQCLALKDACVQAGLAWSSCKESCRQCRVKDSAEVILSDMELRAQQDKHHDDGWFRWPWPTPKNQSIQPTWASSNVAVGQWLELKSPGMRVGERVEGRAGGVVIIHYGHIVWDGVWFNQAWGWNLVYACHSTPPKPRIRLPILLMISIN